MQDCVFCRIIRGEAPARKVWETDEVLVILDRDPVAAGHALVLPKRHSEDLSKMSDDELAKVMVIARRVGVMQRTTHGASGFNLLTACGRDAQQSVFHAHLHVVPRFAGDGLDLWFHRQSVTDQQP